MEGDELPQRRLPSVTRTPKPGLFAFCVMLSFHLQLMIAAPSVSEAAI
jgi:hypothetical protein